MSEVYSFNELKKKISELLGQNKTSKIFKVLDVNLTHGTDCFNDYTLLKRSFIELEKEIRRGVIGNVDASIRSNSLHGRLMMIIENISEEDIVILNENHVQVADNAVNESVSDFVNVDARRIKLDDVKMGLDELKVLFRIEFEEMKRIMIRFPSIISSRKQRYLNCKNKIENWRRKKNGSDLIHQKLVNKMKILFSDYVKELDSLNKELTPLIKSVFNSLLRLNYWHYYHNEYEFNEAEIENTIKLGVESAESFKDMRKILKEENLVIEYELLTGKLSKEPEFEDIFQRMAIVHDELVMLFNGYLAYEIYIDDLLESYLLKGKYLRGNKE